VNSGLPTRACVATAPPKYPVSRIAPNTEVRGIMYRIVDATSTTPSGMIEDSGYPSCMVPSTTGAGLKNFATPSAKRNNEIKPLMMRPVHTLALETPVDLVSAGSNDVCSVLLIDTTGSLL